MQTFWNLLYAMLGLGIEPKELTFVQITVRAVIVFVSTLIMMRIGDRRALAKKTAFDTVLLILLASMLARAINGSAAFFATIAAAFVIVLVHRSLAFLTFHFPGFGNLIKGKPRILFQSDEFRRKVMQSSCVNDDDLLEDLRLRAEVEEMSRVKVARLERSGDLSFILKSS